MKVAQEVWVTTALLHKENPDRADFAVQEIKGRARQESWGDTLRPGFNQHAVYHCLANKAPNHVNHRMLYETARGRKRLYRLGDQHHPDRAEGKIRPDKWEIPSEYHPLVDWYDNVYAVMPRQSLLTPTDEDPANNPNQEDGKIPSSISTLVQLFSKPLFASSSGDLVIPRSLLNELGVRAGGPLSIRRENDYLVLQPITEDFISSLLGSYKGETNLVEAREREHRIER
jgi:hypothetical protein